MRAGAGENKSRKKPLEPKYPIIHRCFRPQACQHFSFFVPKKLETDAKGRRIFFVSHAQKLPFRCDLGRKCMLQIPLSTGRDTRVNTRMNNEGDDQGAEREALNVKEKESFSGTRQPRQGLGQEVSVATDDPSST